MLGGIIFFATQCRITEFFFSNRVVNLWNNLPVCTDFTSFRKFNGSIIW